MNQLRRLRRRLRSFFSTSAFLYSRFAPYQKGDRVVTPATDIVIEGYPRSGNSFAEAAFRYSQKRPIKIAHHCHAAAQILAAANWKVPCLVVVREPVEAGRSLMMLHPDLFSGSDALWEYCVFHEAIVKVRESYYLASFESVTRDFGAVLAGFNVKFGTQFEPFEHTPENEAAAFALLDSLSHDRGKTDESGEAYSPTQSDKVKKEREELKERARADISVPQLEPLRQRAQRIYRDLMVTKDI